MNLQSWLLDICKNYFNKEEITEEDLEKITYFKLDTMDDITIELSTEEPPRPFSDTNGGDEWKCCTLYQDQIKTYVSNVKAKKFEKINYNGEYCFSTTPFSYEHEELELSKEDCEKAGAFEKTISRFSYKEEIEYYGAYEDWLQTTSKDLIKGISVFPNLRVLRIHYGHYESLGFMHSLDKLECLELVECIFLDPDGFDEITKCNQLCCWMN